jgi:pyruvate dehydrogenase E2 component (dihydrolipoamide acetyltransferase)
MHLLHLPRLGQTMERGTVEEWSVAEGAAFAIDDPLYRVSTDKVDVEVEAKLPGTLARIVLAAGQEVEVGTLLGVVADPGELLDAAAIDSAVAADLAEAGGPESAPLVEVAGLPGAQAVAQGAVAGGGAPPGGRVKALPKARARAAELGVDLAGVAGTGADGAITVEDVEAAAAGGGSGAPGSAPGSAGALPGVAVRERRPVRGVARAMAEAVTRSWAEVPQFTQQVSFDATALKERRARERAGVREAHGIDLTYTDLIVDAVVEAVHAVPEANATFAGGEIILYEDVNVGVAVATAAGLVVPVVRRAQTLDLGARAAALHAVAGRAREGRLAPDDVSGATITVSNLGMQGIDGGMPLVPVPNAAIVFAGTLADRAWVVDGALAVRPVLSLSNGYDHRVLDGATAARFTSALVAALGGRA